MRPSQHRCNNNNSNNILRRIIAASMACCAAVTSLYMIFVVGQQQLSWNSIQEEEELSSLLPYNINNKSRNRIFFPPPNWTRNNNNNNHSISYKQVQYNSGFIQNMTHPTPQDLIILNQCESLLGLWYDAATFSNNNNHPCLGPLINDTTCCYCYYSYDYEDVVFATENRYWKCARARSYGLIPFPASPLVYNNNNANNKPQQQQHTPKVAMVTGKFCYNDTCAEEVNEFCQQVLQIILLDPQYVTCHSQSPPHVLQNPKFHRHLQYRNNPHDESVRGGGFWFHKPIIILYELQHRLKDGDILVYTDVDRIDFFHLGSFHAIVETMTTPKPPRTATTTTSYDDDNEGDDLCVESMFNTIESDFDKGDMLAAFNASWQMRESPHMLANALVLRNSPRMRQLINAWVDCVSDYHMVSDEPSILPNTLENEGRNRHDQSILSLLIKTYMIPQLVVGPPARAYHRWSEYRTFRFKTQQQRHHHGDDSSVVDPMMIHCPFASFNVSMYVQQPTT